MSHESLDDFPSQPKMNALLEFAEQFQREQSFKIVQEPENEYQQGVLSGIDRIVDLIKRHPFPKRQVHFKAYIPPKSVTSPQDYLGDPPIEEGTGKYENSFSLKGFFYQFLNQRSDNTDYLYAVVELPDGKIELVDYTIMKFDT